MRRLTLVLALAAMAAVVGELSADLDPGQETVTLPSPRDGLVSYVLAGHYPGEVALAAVDGNLNRLFGGAPSTAT